MDWHILQRMLIDAPKYDTKEEKDNKKGKSIKLSEQKAEDLIKDLAQYQ